MKYSSIRWWEETSGHWARWRSLHLHLGLAEAGEASIYTWAQGYDICDWVEPIQQQLPCVSWGEAHQVLDPQWSVWTNESEEGRGTPKYFWLRHMYNTWYTSWIPYLFSERIIIWIFLHNLRPNTKDDTSTSIQGQNISVMWYLENRFSKILALIGWGPSGKKLKNFCEEFVALKMGDSIVNILKTIF